MNPQTGELFSKEEIEKRYGNIPKVDFADMVKDQGLVEVKRDLTEREILDKQILLYAPCACGSGKKFKFCCHKTGAGKEPEGKSLQPTTDKVL